MMDSTSSAELPRPFSFDSAFSMLERRPKPFDRV